MHKRTVFLILVFGVVLCACGGKKDRANESEGIEVSQQSVEAFAKQIEQSVLSEKADFLNNSFDKEHIKTLIRDNSIVSSSLDADFGKQYFDDCFYTGTEMVRLVEAGGDYKFVKYYFDEKDSTHHIVMRSYVDFMINFYDYIVDSCGGKLVIKDGFIYNTGCKLSDNVRENVLLNALYLTNPEGTPKLLADIRESMNQKHFKEAEKKLQEHKSELEEYNIYHQFMIINWHENLSKKDFADSVKNLAGNNIDKRYKLIHLLSFYTNEGMVAEAEEITNKLIEYTGDDPIYLLLFGKANFIAKKFQDALYCYETSSEFLPEIWDLWFGKLECYNALGEKEKYINTLESGKSNYNMSTEELNALTKKHFPKMEK